MPHTSLYPEHTKAQAKMVDFHGWHMPLEYIGIIKEHQAVRRSLGLFDVSHMGKFHITGRQARELLQFASSNDLGLINPGQVQYSLLLNDQGGIVDDVTILKESEDAYSMVVNAANIQKDLAHLQSIVKVRAYLTDLKDKSGDYSLLALQGQNAQPALQKLISSPLGSLGYYRFLVAEYCDREIQVSRVGYTGEDGFEIMLENQIAVPFWQDLLRAGQAYDIQPVGLGARDTLRLEVGFHLYGQDITDDTNPFEAGLSWLVKLSKPDFMAKDKLLKYKQAGVSRKLVAFRYNQPGVPRSQYEIQSAAGEKIGQVTSGSFSPTLKLGIGMGYIQSDYAKLGQEIMVNAKTRRFSATIVKNPQVLCSKPYLSK